MTEKRRLSPEDRPRIAELLEQVSAFTDEERAVALELVDTHIAQPESDDYRFILSYLHEHGRSGDGLAGYLCYGRTPMTQATYDLYWVATSPALARSGVARGLVTRMEGEIAQEGGGIVRVETGSREGHGAAVHFYDSLGFARTAVIPDFYAPGDDLLIFIKRVRGMTAPEVPARDEAALYDAAFGYRDYAAERDFLLACARRFGDRDVRRVLAWACGPARHLEAFAEAGIAGVGVDSSEAMIAYAQRVLGARMAERDVRFLRANLDESPGAPVRPVDLSFVPLSSIHQLTTPEALERHLRIAASLLLPGGLHVIEATHPADLLQAGVSHTEWTEMRGEHVVDARFRIHTERATPERVVPVTLEVVCSGKKTVTGGGQPAITSLKQQDLWYIPDLAGWRRAIANVPELALVATLGDFNVDVPFEHAAAWRLILVLKRA